MEALAPATPDSALEDPTAALAAIVLGPDAERERDEAASTAADLVVPGFEQASSVELASIRGRLLLPGGAPAAGGSLRVSTWKLTSWWSGRVDPRAGGYESETASAHDGWFELRFDPPPGHVVELRASLRGHGEAHWQWDAIDPGEILDVGDVTLAPAGTLLVRVVDSTGQPVPGSWSVGVWEQRAFGEDDGRIAAHLLEGVDPLTGMARLEGVSAGRAQVRAYSELAETLYAEVRVEAGSTQEVELRYLGPDPSRRIVVLAACEPFYPLRPEAGAFVLRGQGLERRSGGWHEFDDLPPGTYSVALEDERFEPWSAEGLQPGEAVVARLRGAAALVLNPVDATDGNAIERYALSIELGNPFWIPEPFLIQELGAEPPPGGIFRGLGPIPQTAIVEAPGYARVELPILDLRPGERRALDVRLWPALRIAGEVVHADGSPAAGVTVQIVEPGAGPERPSEESEETDRAGRFALEGLAPGTFTLHAHSNPWLVCTLEGVVLSEGESLEGLRLELPPHARIRGRVLAPPGTRDENLILSFRPAGEPAFDNSYVDAPAVQVPIGPDRSFDSGPLPPGRIEILLWREIGPMDSLGFVATRETGLRELELAPDEVADVELDLSALWPARLLVRLEWLEAHREGYWVVASREPDSPAALSANQGVGEDGRVELGPLDPGPYWVYVFASGVPGSWPAPAPIVLEPAARHEMSMLVHLAAGEITLLDAVGGIPLAGARVRLSDGLQPGFSMQADEAGRLRLEMPPGRYAVFMRADGSGAGRRATLDWGAAGPTSASLVLEAEGVDPARSR